MEIDLRVQMSPDGGPVQSIAKARLLAQGFSQVPFVDDAMFVPGAKAGSIKYKNPTQTTGDHIREADSFEFKYIRDDILFGRMPTIHVFESILQDEKKGKRKRGPKLKIIRLALKMANGVKKKQRKRGSDDKQYKPYLNRCLFFCRRIYARWTIRNATKQTKISSDHKSVVCMVLAQEAQPDISPNGCCVVVGIRDL